MGQNGVYYSNKQKGKRKDKKGKVFKKKETNKYLYKIGFILFLFGVINIYILYEKIQCSLIMWQVCVKNCTKLIFKNNFMSLCSFVDELYKSNTVELQLSQMRV